LKVLNGFDEASEDQDGYRPDRDVSDDLLFGRDLFTQVVLHLLIQAIEHVRRPPGVDLQIESGW
jgi:hypothetical protein